MSQPFIEPCDTGIIAAAPCPREQRRELPPGRRRVVLAGCVLASSMGFIDGSALTVALPNLRADLMVGFSSLQWVLNGYVLALASLMLVGGALADVVGKARMVSVGSLLFALASVACAFAPSVAWLIAARVAQGVAATIFTPASLALIGVTYPLEERGRAVGVWAAASALTTAAGPVLGGWLTDMFGWRAIFWINPPIALVAIALLAASGPGDRREVRTFDVAGAAILVAALGTLSWVLSHIAPAGPQADVVRASPTGMEMALLAGFGVAGLLSYGVWERRTTHPMTPPYLAGNRVFLGLNIATLFVYGGLAIMFFILPFDLIDRRALSPAATGLVFLPFTLGVGLLSRLFGGLAERTGPRVLLIAGAMGAALAYGWMALGRAAPLVTGVLVPMALLGLSFAVLVAPLTTYVLSSVDKSDEGLASGINNAASRIAQLAGVALAAGVASLTAGYQFGMALAAVASLGGAVAVALTIPGYNAKPHTGGGA